MSEQFLREEVKALVERLDRLECKWDALIRRLEGLERHPEDEGWFD
jgi:ubiquinone biosynthesis protein UbiJ